MSASGAVAPPHDPLSTLIPEVVPVTTVENTPVSCVQDCAATRVLTVSNNSMLRHGTNMVRAGDGLAEQAGRAAVIAVNRTGNVACPGIMHLGAGVITESGCEACGEQENSP
jgi:hypothetical protein